MHRFIDQMGRAISLEHYPPKRIISLVPSQTELLYDLGLTEEVVGITKFCIHPREWFKSKTMVGGTKQYKMDRIAKLKPDLIIGNKEENERLQIEELAKNYPVWMSDITTLEDAYKMIVQVGQLVNKSQTAEFLVTQIKAQFKQLTPSPKPCKVAYFIWHKPLMVAAKGTFINELLEKSGFENVYAHKERYPATSPEELRMLNPDIILLSSEPFPFKTKHIEAFSTYCQPLAISLVDGELFSWYGSRLLKSASYFNKLRNDLFSNI